MRARYGELQDGAGNPIGTPDNPIPVGLVPDDIAALRARLPMRGAVELTASDDEVFEAGRELVVVATVAGDVALTMADGSAITIAVPTGTTRLPWAVIAVLTTGTDATAVYFNLT